MKFRTKLLLAMFMVGVVCTAVAVFVSSQKISEDLQAALVEKSRAILSRLNVGAGYVAQMNTLNGVIAETKKLYPDGRVPDEQKLKILKSVPIYAAFKIGEEGAKEQNYRFRIASAHPRNRDNQATPKEAEVIEQFNADNKLQEVVYKSEDGESVSVVIPVRISEARNCLACHGHPSTSPWGNGKDILGYAMEDLKDGDLRATFAVVSSLKPVKAAAAASTKSIITWGVVATIFALLMGFLLMKKPLDSLANIAERVTESCETIAQSSDVLSSASQELASSSQEQAASVEEVSSSLEEISGMVASSVKGSEDSLSLSNKVVGLVADGVASMDELQDSVQQIAEANTRVEQLSKLIEEVGEKTELIDEIVFQTRLLSFNASVEAERAGEHGRGFAVVAQEVGNLAQMSGKSAAEISQIVKNSIKEAADVVALNKSKVEQGVVLCKKTAESLKSIDVASKEILKGSESILRASDEQKTGIQQINQSMQLVSKAVHENASAAENCSNTSISLTKEGEKLNGVVTHLKDLVYGGESAEGPARGYEQNAKSHNNVSQIRSAKRNSTPKVGQFSQANMKKTGTSGDSVADEGDPWEKI